MRLSQEIMHFNACALTQLMRASQLVCRHLKDWYLWNLLKPNKLVARSQTRSNRFWLSKSAMSIIFRKTMIHSFIAKCRYITKSVHFVPFRRTRFCEWLSTRLMWFLPTWSAVGYVCTWLGQKWTTGWLARRRSIKSSSHAPIIAAWLCSSLSIAAFNVWPATFINRRKQRLGCRKTLTAEKGCANHWATRWISSELCRLLDSRKIINITRLPLSTAGDRCNFQMRLQVLRA